MQGQPESRRYLLRTPTRRQRRAAQMNCGSYNFRCVPGWFLAPIGGWGKATPAFAANFARLVDALYGQLALDVRERLRKAAA